MTGILRGTCVGCTLVGSSMLLFGFVTQRTQAVYSCLFAFTYVCTLLVGALFLLMIGHASNATWLVPVRRTCERILGALPLLPVLLLPILLFHRELYAWAHWQNLPSAEQLHVRRKLTWLNPSFFVLRSLAYSALLVLFSERLRRLSAKQDSAGDPSEARLARHRMARWSIGGLVLLSFVFTFASWDWVMTLEPTWYSNLYGVYLFAGGLLAALSLLVLAVAYSKRQGDLPDAVSSQHYYALGRLQLTMVVFWAYIGWCHVLQQWIANLPLELSWYVRRWHRGWQWEGVALVVLHFALPFLLLLGRATKKHPKALASVSVWLLLVHAIDVHYLVLPVLHAGWVWHWLDIAALLTFASLSLLMGSLRGRRLAPMPVRDPLLERGLAYEGSP